MKWFQRMYFSIILVCITFGTSSMALNVKPPSNRCILIKVKVADRDDANALANMDLDIWNYREGGLTIRVTDDERRQVIESGFTIETITENVYEYLEKIRQDQISLFAEPATAKYHSYDEVIDELIALEDSGVVQTYIIGNTHEGRDIWAVKISDNPSDAEDEPCALFFGCQHAREWIAIEVPLYIAQYLADNYKTDAEIKRLVDNSEIWIVPVVNPDGYEYSRTVDQMWRKNRRDNGDGTFGVDLNRNWGYMWGGPDASPKTSKENYRGPSAFSEPETQAIRDLVLAYDFQVMLDYHNYGQETYHPWEYTLVPCPDDLPMSAMTFRMRELIKQTSGAIYTDWWDSLGAYTIGGGSADWGYGELGIYTFGIELPPKSGGFALAENRILPACEENLPAALFLISLSVENGGIENLTTGKTYGCIQFAINDANDGDEIVLDPGFYQENIIFKGKNLALRSIDPNDPNVIAATVIEGSPQGPVITLSGSGNGGYLLEGLTITGTSREVCISCNDVSPTIRNCVIESNGPNAIEFLEGYEPTIIDCTIIVSEWYSPGLVAYWSLDETEGEMAYEKVQGKDCDLHGEPVWQPDGGKVAGALEFDGIDDYVSTPFIITPGTGDFSIFAWIKSGAAGQVILSQAGSANWLMADLVDGALKTDIKEPAKPGRDRKPPGPPLICSTIITDGDWHRVGFVRDGINRILYVDDIEVACDTAANLEVAGGGLYIGAGSDLEPGTFWSGLIDEVRIYNRVVSP